MPGMNTNIGNEGSFTNSPNPQNNALDNQSNSNIEQKQPVQKPTMGPDEILAIIQQAGEQWKFEVMQQAIDAVNSESMLLMSVDPTSATSVRAVASALNKSVSSFFPIGENDLFNQYKAQQAGQLGQAMVAGASQPQQQPQGGGGQSQPKPAEKKPTDKKPEEKKDNEKKAADELSDFVYNTVSTKIANTGYFEQFNLEKIASDEEKTKITEYIQKDIYDVIEKVAIGMNKFSEDNDVDFMDSSNWDTLRELIEDGTMIEIGEQELTKVE